jgi:hypothetical protein
MARAYVRHYQQLASTIPQAVGAAAQAAAAAAAL